ncbi:hypothetical protein D3C80_508560 [compost metagenome]
MAVLAATTGLADELAFNLTGIADLLAIGHLRLADVGLDTEFTPHAVNDDVQVQLAHAGDNGLCGFFIGAHAKGRVFLGQLAQGDAHLLLVGLGLGFDRHRNHRVREVHAFEDDWFVDIAQGVASGDVFHADQRGDITGAHGLDLGALVGMHLHHTPDPFLFAFDRVEHRVAGTEYAGIDAGEGQGADEGVGGNLERQGRKRLAVVSVALQVLVFVIRIGAIDGGDFRGRWQVVDDRIEHQRHAFVLERGAADRRDNFIGQGALAQAGLDLLIAQLFTVEVKLHELVIGLGGRFDHVCAPLVGQRQHVFRNVFFAIAGAVVIFIPIDGLHLHQVDLADEVLLGANRQLDRYRMVAQALVDLFDHLEEVSALAVHFVDIGHARHMVFVGLAPDRLRLRFHAIGAAEHHHGTVEYTQRALHLNGEVNVTGGVDDVETVFFRELLGRALPERRGRCRGDGDPAFLLLGHPVHGCGAVVHLAHFVVDPGVEQDPFGGGGLARVNMGDDTDIAVQLDGGGARHDGSPVDVCVRR